MQFDSNLLKYDLFLNNKIVRQSYNRILLQQKSKDKLFCIYQTGNQDFICCIGLFERCSKISTDLEYIFLNIQTKRQYFNKTFKHKLFACQRIITIRPQDMYLTKQTKYKLDDIFNLIEFNIHQHFFDALTFDLDQFFY